MKQFVLSLAFVFGLGFSAFAQHMPRRPVPSIALLKAQAKRADGPAVVVPAAAAIPVEVTPAYNGESAKIFATKIHPILMNACAGCHGRSDHAGGYKLKRLEEGYVNAQGIERNLQATVKQLDRTDPGASPFLIKAITAHGKSKDPPLFSKAHPAYKYLELWAYWATMRDGAPIPITIPQSVAKRPEVAPSAAHPIPLKPMEAAKPPQNFGTEVTPAEPGRVNPDDPFDPGAFNHAAHPQRK